jgi:hypothetical protein
MSAIRRKQKFSAQQAIKKGVPVGHWQRRAITGGFGIAHCNRETREGDIIEKVKPTGLYRRCIAGKERKRLSYSYPGMSKNMQQPTNIMREVHPSVIRARRSKYCKI